MRCARRWPPASRRSRRSSTTTSAATASPTSCSPPGTKVLRCSARGDGGALVALAREPRRRRRSAPTTCRRSRAGSPASAVGLQLHGVSDPGNLGTLLRSAQGFGPGARGAGRGLRRPALAARRAREHGRALLGAGDHAARGAARCRVIALDARGERTLAELEPARAGRVRAGRRAHAACRPRSPRAADAVARIPLADGAESLNVAIAGALALYELRALDTAARSGSDPDDASARGRRRPGRPCRRSSGVAVEARLGRRSTSGPASAQSARHSAALRHSSVIDDDAARQADVELEAPLAGVPAAAARRCPRARAIQRSWVARMSAALGSKTSKTNCPPSASSDAAARAALRSRSSSPARCMNVRKGAITRSLRGSGGRARAGRRRRSRRDRRRRGAARAPLGLGQHRRRRVERDHAMAVARELDRDAPAAGAELDDRPRRALAGERRRTGCRGRRRRTSGRRAARAARRARRRVLLLRVASAVEWRLRRRRRRVGGRRPRQGAGPRLRAPAWAVRRSSPPEPGGTPSNGRKREAPARRKQGGTAGEPSLVPASTRGCQWRTRPASNARGASSSSGPRRPPSSRTRASRCSGARAR